MKIDKLSNKKIAILWYGKEWKSTANYLKNNWIIDITLLDKNSIETDDFLSICWDIYLDNLDTFDIVIKSWWISPYISELKNFWWTIITHTQLFIENYKWKVIGITGTKGKSTTSSLLQHVLSSLGYKSILLWNIWTPALDYINTSYDFVIHEFSSYMLDWYAPKLDIWMLINIFPDHLDWHNNSFEIYKNSKLNILKHSKIKVAHASVAKYIETDEVFFYQHLKSIHFKDWKIYNWKKLLFWTENIQLVWIHNKENVVWVLAILQILDIDLSTLQSILTSFSPLKHRLQKIWVFNWITFINDSISTTPESTIEWIKTYWETIDTIFLWWLDRWYDFTNLVAYLNEYDIKNIILFPENGTKIKTLLPNDFNIFETEKMSKWVEFAFNSTEKWKVVLFSTASPSYNLWKNFEAQWDDFIYNVQSFTF